MITSYDNFGTVFTYPTPLDLCFSRPILEQLDRLNTDILQRPIVIVNVHGHSQYIWEGIGDLPSRQVLFHLFTLDPTHRCSDDQDQWIAFGIATKRSLKSNNDACPTHVVFFQFFKEAIHCRWKF